MGSRYEYRYGEFARPLLGDGVLLACVTESLLPRRDTAGQERYQTITKQYYRRAQVTSAPLWSSRRAGGFSNAALCAGDRLRL